MRIILLLPQMPWPPIGGARARHWHLFRHVAAHHEIHVLVLRPPGEPSGTLPEHPFASFTTIDIPTAGPPRFSGTWLALRIRSLRHPAAAWYTAEGRAAFRALIERVRPQAIVYGMSWVLPYAPIAAGIPGIVDEHNYDPLITERMASRVQGLSRVKWRIYAGLTAAAERRNLRQVRGIAACSPEEAAIFRREAPHATVALVPNGVNSAAYTVSPPGEGVVMTGSFAYAPNRDGARRFVSRIWPRVRAAVPAARLRFAGMASDSALGDLAGTPGVTIAGTVEDMRTELAQARVAIAPIDIGAGTRIKILEAWAAGRPVVSTTIGAEGLGARDGETLFVRDDDDGFADCIVALLTDRGLATAMGAKGRAFVERSFDWRICAERFESLLADVAA